MRVVAKLLLWFCLIYFVSSSLSYSETTIKKGYYPNGQLKSEVPIVNGKKHGIALYYHENGKKHKEENYKDGKRDGVSFYYHRSGSYNKYNYDNGEIITEEYFNDNGVLLRYMEFQKGVRTGLQGQNQAQIYREYYDNGSLELECNYVTKSLRSCKYFDEEGEITRIREYENGKEISDKSNRGGEFLTYEEYKESKEYKESHVQNFLDLPILLILVVVGGFCYLGIAHYYRAQMPTLYDITTYIGSAIIMNCTFALPFLMPGLDRFLPPDLVFVLLLGYVLLSGYISGYMYGHKGLISCLCLNPIFVQIIFLQLFDDWIVIAIFLMGSFFFFLAHVIGGLRNRNRPNTAEGLHFFNAQKKL